MPDLYESLKQLASGVYDAKNPVEICFGTVESLSPFEVRISQSLVLGKAFFIVRQGVTVRSFEQGDELILLREQGGQKYLILDKKGAL